MAFFSNPLTTPIGQKIEQATNDTLQSEDWSLNLEICDLINTNEETAKDAARAIRKRLTQSPKNFKVVNYTLVLLESCVKNTGPKFHALVCSKDFVQDLVKLIGPKNEPPTSIQQQVLSLIQSWNDAFRHHPELSGVCQVYADLKHKGIEFPPPDAVATPIFTPNRGTSPRQSGVGEESARPPPVGGVSPRHLSTPSPPAPASLTPPPQACGASLSAEVRSKLTKELGVVETNAGVLAEMLSELTPGQEHAEDLQLLQELYDTCRAMQKRVVELVARVADDALTADLLRINDLLNNLFIRYDRHMAKSQAKGSPVRSAEGLGSSHRPPPTRAPAPLSDEEAAAAEVSLIDLGEDDTPALPPALPPQAVVPPSQLFGQLSIGAGKKEDADDFDSFAQSRTSALDAPKKESDGATGNGVPRPGESEVESNFESMERWMSSQPYGSEISSDAFQKFLADRAAAADRLPTVAAATGSNPPPPPDAGNAACKPTDA